MVTVALFLVGDAVQPAQAQSLTPTVFVSNFGQAGGDAGVFRTNSRFVAQSFTTGSQSGGYTLGSIEIRITATPSSAERNTIRAELWSSNAGGADQGRPNAKVADLTVPADPIEAGAVRLAAPASTTLSASTTYFLVVYTTGNFNLGILRTASTDEDAGAGSGWSIGNPVGPTASWNTPAQASGSWASPVSTAPMRIQINAPEGHTTSTDAALSPGFSPSMVSSRATGNSTGAVRAAATPDDASPPIPKKQEQRYPKLGSHLDQLVIQAEEGQASVRDAAEGAAMPHGGTVAVTVHLSGNVDEVVRFLEENGGDSRNVGEDYIEAYVPVTLLGQLSQKAGVIRVREIVAAQPDQGPSRVAGHGVAVHGSMPWNQAGYAGQGVKVGIIDGGFRGLTSLLETDLPATVVARCYTAVGVFTQNLADCEAVDDATLGLPFPECGEAVQHRAVRDAAHGTIVAEAIIDIAPEVSLYIANPRSRADMQDAVEWMASEGVAVINQSQGWFLDGPGDGTSPRSDSPLRTVDLAVARDIVWVNAAGNGARNTWFGGYEDRDGNRVIGFARSLNDEVLDIPVRACRRYTVQLRWEDTWDGASSDLDLYLIHKPSGRLLSISSRDQQSGAHGHQPFEWLSFWSRTNSDDLGLVVKHYGGDAPDWIQLIVWGTASIEHYTRSGSIGNPSESANPGLLAVGAAHWDDVRAIEPYSSRGPTPDGRIKPDIVGADCGAAALEPLDEYSQGFCGTSQAAPHVAGVAALVRQRFPDYTATQVAGYLKDIAQQRQSPDPNNTWGHGFAKLPPPDGSAPTAPPGAFARDSAADLDSLAAAFNRAPQGIWSDGTTMWVADSLNAKLYAYDAVTGARAPGRDFDTLTAAGNTRPQGIWSDGTTMWVADLLAEKLYAYDMETRMRIPGRDFDTLTAAGNTWPQGIWSDGTTMWVADLLAEKLYAYDMETKAPVPGNDFDTLRAARNRSPRGIWSDGTTMWVADSLNAKLYAYDMATRSRASGKEVNALDAAGNWGARGVWSDGTTMWVVDVTNAKIYAYAVALANEPPAFAERATVRTVVENTAPGVNIGAPVRAWDPDGEPLTYSLSGADATSFGIVSGTGQLTTRAGLDHETKTSYGMTVTAADLGGLTDSIDVTITVTNVDEAPAMSGADTVTYAENEISPVATYTAADPEGEAITWGLSGDDEAAFTITGGVLAFAATPDYEAPADADTDNVYKVTVVAADPYGLTDSLDVTVAVTDMDETAGQTLLERYDADSSGSIERDEAIKAIRDYLVDNAISRGDMNEVIRAYLFRTVVTVEDNEAPTVPSAIADATIVSEDGTHEVSLSGVFSDADSDPLSVMVASSDDAVATTSVSADHSTLTVSAQARGRATITVTANDGNGGTVEETFTVTVKAAPVVASAIADVSDLEVEATYDVSLSGVFNDADGDALTLTATSSDNAVATVLTANRRLDDAVTAVRVVGKGEGATTITVKAQDSDGNSVSDTFDVTVVARSSREQPLTLSGPVTGLEVTVTAEDSVVVSWQPPESGSAPDGYIVHVAPGDGVSGSGRTKTTGAEKSASSLTSALNRHVPPVPGAAPRLPRRRGR